MQTGSIILKNYYSGQNTHITGTRRQRRSRIYNTYSIRNTHFRHMTAKTTSQCRKKKKSKFKKIWDTLITTCIAKDVNTAWSQRIKRKCY